MKSIFKNKSLFLDRDGIINKSIILNRKPYSPRSLEEFEIFEGIDLLLNQISKLGFLLIVITNQPDLATNHITKSTLNKFHQLISDKINISKFYVCEHTSLDNCSCRKPRTGLIKNAVKDYNLDLSKSYFIGDRWKDIDAANSDGIYSIFVDYNYKEKLKTKPKKIVNSSVTACEFIITLES